MLAVEEMVLKENKMLRDEGRKIGISEGKRIGISEGKRIGISEGKKIGISEGKRIGVSEGKSIMCINMLKMGYSIETISKISGIAVKELKNLKKNIK